MPSNSPSPKKPIYPIPQEPASNQEACSPTEPTKKTSIQDIQDRRSLELIIGLCGAIGSGADSVKTTLEEELESQGYKVVTIKISALIEKYADCSKNFTTKYERYTALQDTGDLLRKKYKHSVLAELAIREIGIQRNVYNGQSAEANKEIAPELKREAEINKKKMAFIVYQLKHPAEVNLFQELYRNNFYMLGVLRNESQRRARLESDQIQQNDINTLIEKDRKGIGDHSQHVEKSLFRADYFVRNIDNKDKIKRSISKFISLIHGVNGITPTDDEKGMFSAFSASLRSACLSRQVGASIMDNDGNILSTGCNDVPKAGGGLYTSESSTDNRCFNSDQGKCHNDLHKSHLRNEFEKILKDYAEKNSIELDEKSIAKILIEESKAKSIIEYSRAIHAEMDAIISMARSSTNSTKEKTIYCTTYPCHNCARHIVASGIVRVVYIEPYEKSLATQLHGDAIVNSEKEESKNKVIFESFEGVSPKRYSKFLGITIRERIAMALRLERVL